MSRQNSRYTIKKKTLLSGVVIFNDEHGMLVIPIRILPDSTPVFSNGKLGKISDILEEHIVEVIENATSYKENRPVKIIKKIIGRELDVHMSTENCCYIARLTKIMAKNMESSWAKNNWEKYHVACESNKGYEELKKIKSNKEE